MEENKEDPKDGRGSVMVCRATSDKKLEDSSDAYLQLPSEPHMSHQKEHLGKQKLKDLLLC